MEDTGVEDAVFVSTLVGDMVALERNVDPELETSGIAVVIALTTVELLRDVTLPGAGAIDDEYIADVAAVEVEDVAVVLVVDDVILATVEVATVDEDVEETDDAVLVVVVEVPTLAVADGVTVAVDAVEVTLAAAAEDADGVEVAEVTISADVMFTVDSRADADVDETADDMEVEVVDLRVDSDVRS